MVDPIGFPVIDVVVPRADPRSAPADGGPPLGPDEAVPMPATFGFDDVLRGLNPLHHLPVVGTIYRAVTGETIPAAQRIAGSIVTSALMGGPLGVLGTVVTTLAEELWRMGPDSRATRWDDPEAAEKARIAALATERYGAGSG